MSDSSFYYSTAGWWFVLAIVNAGLAEGKGRSRWYWFLISVFIGPIATALIVIWPRVDRAATRGRG